MKDINHKRKREQIFHIVGRGRSGNTLLYKVLDTHPEISVFRETLFMFHLYSRYKHQKQWNEENINNFVDDMYLEDRINTWGLPKDNLKTWLHKQKNITTFSDICRRVYKFLALKGRKNEVSVIGTKNPHFALYMKQLLKIFPESKYIYIVRDYKDNVLSYQDVKFDLKNVSALAYRWNIFNKKILDIQEKFPEIFYILKYEDLVSNPILYLKQLCEFLGIDFSKKMLDFYKSGRNQASIKRHRNIAKPINTERIAKWKKDMSQIDQKKADFICNKLAKKLNYKGSKKTDVNVLTYVDIFIGFIIAYIFTLSEVVIFLLPLRMRNRLINLFRSRYSRKTKKSND
ncbi:hypothetical protein GF362_03395 [Candidatus Dojkabacteria bacterium]|nr:hypothetical protein [Candidatus Dojkabacteria bacterium]